MIDSCCRRLDSFDLFLSDVLWRNKQTVHLLHSKKGVLFTSQTFDQSILIKKINSEVGISQFNHVMLQFTFI